LALDDDAAFRRVAAASTTVNQESRSAAHVVRGVWVKHVAVRHALEGHHVAQAVLALGKGADGHLALAAGVVSARARLAAAAAGGVDHWAIEAHALEVVFALGVGIGASSLEVAGSDLDLVAFLLVESRVGDEEKEGAKYMRPNRREKLRRLFLGFTVFAGNPCHHGGMQHGHTRTPHTIEREIVAGNT
jgi:hypothetical protein